MITRFIPGPVLTNNKQYSHIAIYRDSENPYVFYYINGLPRVQIDPQDGLPKLRFTLFGRNVEKENEEVQEGRLVMTVDLGITNAEKAELLNIVGNYLNSSFRNDIKNYYPNYKGASYNRNSIILRPVDFNEGEVYFNVIEGRNSENKASIKTAPNLFGNCSATFADSFDAQNSQILYDLLMRKLNNVNVGDLMATVVYNLKYDAQVPFKAKASVDTARIYELFQDENQKHSGVDATYLGSYYVPEVGYFYSHGAELYASKESIDNFLRNRCSITSNIKIEIDNKSKDDVGADYEQLLTEMVSTRAQDGICDQLFDKVEAVNPQAQGTKYDVGNNDPDDPNGKKLPGLYDVCYRLKNKSEISTDQHWGIEINKNTTCVVQVNPQANLMVMINPQNINKLVAKIDASEAWFQKLSVPVHVSASNFVKDIIEIDVNVIYDEKEGPNDTVGKRKTRAFQFNKDKKDPQYFNVLMMRDSNGQLLDRFYYQTRIVYEHPDPQYDSLPDDQQYTPLTCVRGIGKGITIGNKEIRNLQVTCKAGDVDWDSIDKIIVKFTYRDDPNRENSRKTIELKKDTPSDTWNCYMYKGNSNYTYEVRYIYKDGTESAPKVFKDSSGMVAINDNLSGTCSATFYVNFDKKAVKRVKVIAKCQGKEYESNWFEQSDSWEWQFRLKEDQKKTYQYMYRYELSNGDGQTEHSEWSEPFSVQPGIHESHEIKVDAKGQNVRIIAKAVDWSQWDEVDVYLKYDDDKNNVHFEEDLIVLNSQTDSHTSSIPIMDKSIRPTIQVTYVNYNGNMATSDTVSVPESGLIVLPASAPPKAE